MEHKEAAERFVSELKTVNEAALAEIERQIAARPVGLDPNTGEALSKILGGIVGLVRWFDEQTPRGRLLWRLKDQGWPDWAASWWAEHCPARWVR